MIEKCTFKKGNDIAVNYSSIKRKEILKGYPERLIHKKLKIQWFLSVSINSTARPFQKVLSI